MKSSQFPVVADPAGVEQHVDAQDEDEDQPEPRGHHLLGRRPQPPPAGVAGHQHPAHVGVGGLAVSQPAPVAGRLEQCGLQQVLGVSAERTRQIEDAALRRLSANGDLAALRDAA